MIEEKCGKECKYDPRTTHLAVSMHHCPLCLQMQIAGKPHTCCCCKCLNEIADYYGVE